MFAALDGHFDDTAILLVPVLQSLIEAVCRWFPSTTRVMVLSHLFTEFLCVQKVNTTLEN